MLCFFILSWFKSVWFWVCFQPDKPGRTVTDPCFWQLATVSLRMTDYSVFGYITTSQDGCATVRHYCIVDRLDKSKSFQALVEWVNSRNWITCPIWITLQRLNSLHCGKMPFPPLQMNISTYFDSAQKPIFGAYLFEEGHGTRMWDRMW